MSSISRTRRGYVAALAATLPALPPDELYETGQRDDWPSWQADEIVPGLFQGGTHDARVLEVPMSNGFDPGFPYDVVVTLYADAQPVPWGVEEVRFGFYDGALDGEDAGRVVRAARYAYTRWVAGDRVLIRCQAGVNRSGLVTALVLVMAGLSPAQAIGLIRARRSSHALFNPDFVTWLLFHGRDAVDDVRAAWPSAPPPGTRAA